MRDFLSARDLPRETIDALLTSARRYREGVGRRWPDAVVGLMFYEGSLRTRVGFEVAAARLQARTTTVIEPRRSEAMWGEEAVDDAVRSIGPSLDMLCLRHPDSKRLADLTETPVINCGNGTDEHPTQALIDLFAIQELVGRLDGLRIGLVGDLEAMRSVHSLAFALASFPRTHVRCIGPEGLDLPEACVLALGAGGAVVEGTNAMDVRDLDVVYMAGLPAQTSKGILAQSEQAVFHMTPPVAASMRRGARVLCPLPRLDEIHRLVDELPVAGYFDQSELGLWVRMAVLDRALTP